MGLTRLLHSGRATASRVVHRVLHVQFPFQSASAAFQLDPQMPFLALLRPDGRVLSLSGTPLGEHASQEASHTRGEPLWNVANWMPRQDWAELLKQASGANGSVSHSASRPEATGPASASRVDIVVTAMRAQRGRVRHFVVEGHGTGDLRAELQEREATLSSAQRLAKFGSWAWTIETDLLWLSPEAFRILGFRQEEFNGAFTYLLERVHEDDLPALHDIGEQIRAGQRSYSYRYRLRTEDGLLKAIRGEGEAQFDAQGNVCRLVGTVMDETEHMAMLQAVRDGQGHIHSIEEGSSEWLWEQDAQYRFTLFVGGGGRIPVEDRRQMIGKRRWEIPNSEPLNGSWKEHIEVLDAREPFRDFDYRVGRTAAARVICVNGSPCYDAGGRFIGYKGTALDVTSRIQAEEEARRSKELLESASRLGRLGAWALDVPDLTLTWTSQTFAIHGYSDDTRPTLDSAIELIQPEWREAVERAVTVCVCEGRPFEMEAKAYTVHKESVWLRIIGEPVRGSDGSVQRVVGAVQDITGRKKSAERLQELTERLTTTLESITDAFFTVDRDWRFTYVNREAERLFGRSREELIGHVVWERFPQSAGTVFHRQYERALAEFKTVEFEEYSELFGLWFHVIAYPSVQGLAVYFRDVSAAKKIQQALADSEERYRMLFETSGDAILQACPDGRVTRANPAACSMFQMTEEQICRAGRSNLVASDDAGLKTLLAAVERDGTARSQVTMVRGDGTRFEAEVTVARYQASDGVAYASVILRDITERLAHEKEIVAFNEELSERVRQRTAELELANTELRSFAHSLAHDLRTPIAVIDAFAGRLEESLKLGMSERAPQYLHRIQAAAQRMNDFVEGLLSLARISQATLQGTMVNLSAMADSILSELRDRDRDRAVAVHVQPGLSAVADERLLRMALENLLGNAWKFTSRRELAEISFIAAQTESHEISYCVKDNGAGFDMAHVEKLFGNFQRLHSQSEFPGTGIGLSNVSRIIARHGGRVWAEGRKDVGATFYFTLGTLMEHDAAEPEQPAWPSRRGL